MRCLNVEELRAVSGGIDPKGCVDAIMTASGAGAAVGSYIGAVGGSVVPALGTGAGIAIAGAAGALVGGAVAAATSPECSTTYSAGSSSDSYIDYMDDEFYNRVVRVQGYYSEDWMWDTAWEW